MAVSDHKIVYIDDGPEVCLLVCFFLLQSRCLFILDVLVSMSCRACSDINVLKTQAIEHPRGHDSELSQALRDRVLIIKLEKEAPGGVGLYECWTESTPNFDRKTGDNHNERSGCLRVFS